MWLSRVIIAATLVWLAGCSAVEVASLGSALESRDVAINVIDGVGEGPCLCRGLHSCKRQQDQHCQPKMAANMKHAHAFFLAQGSGHRQS